MNQNDKSFMENGKSTKECLLPLELEAKNGDSSLISKSMAEEEKLLSEAREKIEKNENNVKHETQQLPNEATQFSKLDELLTQTKLYSEFLLEKMDDITFVTH